MNCVSRDIMPQVLEADLPDLFRYAEAKGIRLLRCNLPVLLLKRNQAVDQKLLRDMPDELLLKPLLTSRDNGILDGNHRHAVHERKGNISAPCNALVLDWQEAMSFLCSFPKVFWYGDGKIHAFAN